MGLSVLGHDMGIDPAADIEARGQPHEFGVCGRYQVIPNLMGDGLMKSPLVTVGPSVKLQRL